LAGAVGLEDTATPTATGEARPMRIALLYPPPWKIPLPGQPPDPMGDGPPDGFGPGDLDGDFYQVPYGLLTLATEALKAGHQVKVLNLSAFPWREVEETIADLDADLFGLSCWTANRRGVALVAQQLRAHHRDTHIVVGGPHASALGPELLAHTPAIDTVAIGESEVTFMELLARLEAKRATQGIAGTIYRDAGRVTKGPARAAIRNLDQLTSPHEQFTSHIMMTSRGCPWACTFCGAESAWGRGFRAHSVPYVLDALERAIEQLPVKMIAIKDDTFTTDRKRVLALCRGIRDRGLRFLWSCDTRVDMLDAELLREMRLAGCQRLSLGVETGAPKILKTIDKKLTVDDIIMATDLAKQQGIKVRFFMMLGNRGETAETFQQTLDFLERARPHEYIFSCLSIYPGTTDFRDAEAAGWLDRGIFFSDTFQELKTPFDASRPVTEMMTQWFDEHRGLQQLHQDGIDDYQTILGRLGEHHAAHLDLGGAYFHAGQLDLAEHHLRRALDLGLPTPGVAHNYLACIAYELGDVQAMMNRLSEAVAEDPQHYGLVRNVETARAWFREGGPAQGKPLELVAHHDFQLLERTVQPTLPGPLPQDVAAWAPAKGRPGKGSPEKRGASS
jgi:anaerobic magnesium-protoporphyrin IX monomethyl ester cyclase